MKNTPKTSVVLILIVISQFACTSLWFAGNAVMSDIINEYGLRNAAVGYFTSAVQLGFILGTLVLSVLTIS
ncbi:MAG: hypothetical protein KDC11_09365, partial [Chitinophagaceae bacterium]|nr:hypothetical protein [Chitinophagaceae bacterium]